jgi:intracellular septation protein
MGSSKDEAGGARKMPQGLAMAMDLGPLVAFFAAYELAGLRVATMVVIAAALAAVAAVWLLTRRFAVMPTLTAAIVGVMGGLTLYLNDPDFIKMKPTIVYLFMAAILGTELISGRALLSRAITAGMPNLSGTGKRVLMIRFLLFFVAMAAINEVLRRVLSTDHWVLWKVFGGIGGTVLFSLAQIPLFNRHKLPGETPAE